jgi:hypothetical protein
VSSTASGMPSEVPRELAQGMKRASLHLTPQARRRALVLLASCPDGCTEAIFAAHNIPAEIVAKLLRKGLATAGADRVGRLWITERGRRGRCNNLPGAFRCLRPGAKSGSRRRSRRT